MADVRNKQAVAVFMAFSNAIHDAIHVGLLNREQAIGMTLLAQKDVIDFLQGKPVEVKHHDGSFLTIDGPEAHAIQGMLDKFEELQKPVKDANGNDIVMTHEVPRGRLN